MEYVDNLSEVIGFRLPINLRVLLNPSLFWTQTHTKSSARISHPRSHPTSFGYRCAMPEAVEARLQKYDLHPRDRQKIQDAVNTYYNLHVKFNQDQDLSEEERWALFAKILKHALDRNLGEHWHVAVGTTLGYACKVRQKAMGVWKFGTARDGCVVVIWKSPGIEPLDNLAVRSSGKDDSKVLKLRKKTKVIFQSDGDGVGEVIDAVCHEMSSISDTKDEQVLATTLRKRLTSDFGPIWHVLAGCKFIVEPAVNCRKQFCIEIAGMRILGFQHEQLNSGILSSLDFPRVLKAMPYLLMTLLCFGYMGFASLCKEGVAEQPGSILHSLKQRLCQENWEVSLRTLGVIVIGLAFCVRNMPNFSKAL